MNNRKWVNLFKEKIKTPKCVEILKKIDLGYLSSVYLISVNGKIYAIKMYDKRYNETEVCLKEIDNIMKARKSIPDALPNVFFYSKHTENDFNREILVMERVLGVPLSKEVFNEQVFEELINVLKKLHLTRTNNKREINEIKRIDNCKKVIQHFLKEKNIEEISRERITKHLDALKNYYNDKKDKFRIQKTMIHGDLWWDNILVNNGKIKIIDWLESSEQDYCRDLAQLNIGTLNEVLDTNESQYFFQKILNVYKEEFSDKTIFERIRFYVSLMYLEESFYLPFKFFPWEIKYKENAKNFRKRFIDYYKKSELFFDELAS
jgi:thiamine kinase-like enzyme